MIRRLNAPLTFVVVALLAGQAFAQGAFPAPLPDQAMPGNASPFPPVTGPIPFTSGGGPLGAPESRVPDACMQGFAPLRDEAERRGRLIKAAAERKASSDEACKLIADFSQAEFRLLNYVEANATACGIPSALAARIKTGHKSTRAMLSKVCAAAPQAKGWSPAAPVGDFWPASSFEPAGPVGETGFFVDL